MISIRYYISDIKKKKKKVRKTIMTNANQKKLNALKKESKKLHSEAVDLITEYLDVEELSLDDIKEELAQIKKKYLDSWSEASELM